MLKETLGDDWLTPDLFRFGASTLVNDCLMQIVKAVDGRYQAAVYVLTTTGERKRKWKPSWPNAAPSIRNAKGARDEG